jgi:ferredoxin
VFNIPFPNPLRINPNRNILAGVGTFSGIIDLRFNRERDIANIYFLFRIFVRNLNQMVLEKNYFSIFIVQARILSKNGYENELGIVFSEKLYDQVKQAAEGCPVKAILIEKLINSI